MTFNGWVGIAIALLMGLATASVQLAVDFPDLKWLFSALAAVVIPVANQLRQMVEKKETESG